MTLITNPTRVHFADDVLQEALQSELERSGCKKILLIAEKELFDGEFSDRIHAGLPHSVRPQVLDFSPKDDLRDIALSMIEKGIAPDGLIAFGSVKAIELSRKCRYALGQKHRKRPLLYAVPGVDGLPDPCTKNIESWRAGLPSVLICDPTLALDAGQSRTRDAVVTSLVRCVESYLADSFNPPADGMALDGLSRCVKSLPKTNQSHILEFQRDVMAAGLNAAFSQEKGIGPASVLASSLRGVAEPSHETNLTQLMLLGVLREKSFNDEKVETLLNVLGSSNGDLASTVEHILSDSKPLKSLSDLGYSQTNLDLAAQAASGLAGLSFPKARELLDDIH